MKRCPIILVLVLAVLLTLFSACSSNSEKPVDNSSNDASNAPSGNITTENKKVLFGVSVRSFASPYFVTITDHMQAYANENTEFVVTSGDDDVTKQLSDVEDMIQQGCDVIMIACCDSAAIKPALKACQDAGVPVVIYDSPANDVDMVACTVASDNYTAGFEAGEALAKSLDYKGDIAEYIDLTSEVTANRVQGFRDAIAQYPDIKIVNTQEGAGNSESAVPVMENILQSTPDIVGLFAFNDPSANGCISVIAAAGKTGQIQVVSIDGLDMAMDAILDGKQLGTGFQRADLVAQYAIDAAYEILEGKTPEKEIKVPVTFVDINNIDEYYTREG